MTSDDKQEGPGNTSRLAKSNEAGELKKITRENVDVRTHRPKLLLRILRRRIDIETLNLMKIKIHHLFKNKS